MQIVFEFEAPRLQNYGLNSEIRECVICYKDANIMSIKIM